MPSLSEALAVAQDHHRHGRLREADKIYREILALDPNHCECLHFFGRLAAEAGRSDIAIAVMSRAVELKPDFAAARNDLGNVLFTAQRIDEAIEQYKKAIAVRPNDVEPYFNLGNALCAQDRLAEAFAAFTRMAELLRSAARDRNAEPPPAPPHKAKHDREQLDYWMTSGPIGQEAGRLQAIARAAGASQNVAQFFDRVSHIESGEALAGPAINPAHDVAAIETRWRDSRPNIVVVDDLLSQDALRALRRFCLGSTIWRRVYESGYLGSMPEHGFASPLMAQIADELRRKLSGIFAGHHLTRLWAFKCDSAMSGTSLHADFAAVNVNFWITPDEANLDPQSGGLVLWDVPAPPDWDFKRYNGNIAACRAFLASQDAKSVTIPYRANRAVIFDSDLFHETDRIAFTDGYANRRINVTLLYGWRSGGGSTSIGP